MLNQKAGVEQAKVWCDCDEKVGLHTFEDCNGPIIKVKSPTNWIINQVKQLTKEIKPGRIVVEITPHSIFVAKE